jgi:Fur family ferric uptake transcriptional regulator
VESVAERLDTFTAQEVVDTLQARDATIGRATVFRTLDLLTDLGVLHRIHNAEGFHRYAVCADNRHHHHLRCIVCGTIQVVQAPEVEVDIERLGARFDFEVLDHVIELTGRCSTCRRG